MAARRLEWRSSTIGNERQFTDHVGFVVHPPSGKEIDAFRVSERDDGKFECASLLFRSRLLRGKTFVTAEAAKSACQQSLDAFVKWLGKYGT